MSRGQRRFHQKNTDDAAVPFTMELPSQRIARLSHLIFEELDRLFRMEVRDKALQAVTVTSLNLSPDLRNVKVYYAITDEAAAKSEGALRDGLQRVAPFLRARVAEAVSLKRTPDLHFHRDRMAEASLRAELVLLAEQVARSQKAREEAAAAAPSPSEKADPK